jgi:hypothetical protein
MVSKNTVRARKADGAILAFIEHPEFISSKQAGHLVKSTIQRARSLRLPPPLSLRRMARRTIGASHFANTSVSDLTTAT